MTDHDDATPATPAVLDLDTATEEEIASASEEELEAAVDRAEAPTLAYETRLAEGYQRLLDGDGFDVKVSGHWKVVKPHPLALSYPLMSVEAFTSLVEDIASYGFREPVTLIADTGVGAGKTYELDVLEGRHRVAVAWVLGLSVNGAVLFNGSDQEADALVDSLNLHRRHLNPAQRALLVVEKLLPVAKREAKARMLAGKVADPTANWRQGTAAQIAAARAGDAVSSRSVERLARIAEAPTTRARIFAGDIPSVDAARTQMLAEINGATPADGSTAARKPPVKPRLGLVNKTGAVSTSSVLDTAKTSLRKAIEQAMTEDRPQRRSITKQRALIEEIRDLCLDFEGILDDQAVHLRK